ncbi:MAG: EAL domain-containing protein, partial [Methyloprofundus sp.]|nr:EAL domain-containing protein [Methyloprofundus sp.]
FYPASFLMGRLNFAKKSFTLALFILFSFFIISSSLYIQLNTRINSAKTQLIGLEALPSIFKAIQEIQQHRGLSASVLGGNHKQKEQLSLKTLDTTKSLQLLKIAIPTNMSQSAPWLQSQAHWQEITKAGMTWSVEKNFSLHSQLVQQLLILSQELADKYLLTNQTDIATYYLINTMLYQLAPTQEFMGETRAKGMGIIAAGASTEIQRQEIYTLLSQVKYTTNLLGINLKRTGYYNPEIQSILTHQKQEIMTISENIAQLVEHNIFQKQYSILPEEFFDIITVGINRTYHTLYNALLPTAVSLTKKQLLQHQIALQQITLIIVLLFLFLFYFSVGVYLSIQKNIQSISKTAIALAHGDYQERSQLAKNNDELNVIRKSLNFMADQLTQHIQNVEAGKRRIQAIVDSSHEGVTITDHKGLIIDTNKAFTQITGYSHEEVIGKNPSLLSSGKQSSEFYTAMWHSVNNNKFWSGEVWNRKKSGELFISQLSITAVVEDNQQYYVGMLSDITENKEQQANLEMMAHYDVLTQLPNRALFADRFRLALAHSKRKQSILAVCFLDLDNFKPINDNYGHATGDQLLIEVSNRLKACVRDDDTVSRQGGDEFALLIGDIESKSECEEILARIHTSLYLPYLIDGQAHQVTASCGVTLFPNDNADIDTLVRHADQAMYQAKLAGKHQFQFFNPQQDKQLKQEYNQREEVHEALTNQELVLYYQPKVNMRTGKVFGAEALIRWAHPSKGIIPPLTFLPLIEGTDLEIEVGNWVIDQALNQLNRWLANGLTLEISVNISSYHLQSPLFINQLESTLEKYPLVPSHFLQLEILESSALSDLYTISHIIQTCQKTLGVSIALDDFGTGYSSLTHLRNLSANIIKIDQSFVRDVLEDPSDYAIIDGVIGLSQAFNRDVIAEGVETTHHGLMLLLMGCNKAQGYGISRPLPAANFSTWLTTYQANQVWIEHANKTYHTKARKTEIFKLISIHWLTSFEERLHLPANTDIGWPILDRKKCPCGTWIKREQQSQVFPQNKLEKLKSMHDSAHNLATELTEQYATGHIKYSDLNSLRDLFKDMGKIVENLTAD